MFYFKEEYLNWKNNLAIDATNSVAEIKNNYIFINASISEN